MSGSLKQAVEAKRAQFAERSAAAPAATEPLAPRTAPGALFAEALGVAADRDEIARLQARLRLFEGSVPTRDIALASILDNPYQPRLVFDPVQLDELAASIDESGLIQPIAVRPGRDEGTYILIAGDRRRQAVQRLGRNTIRALVFDIGEAEAALASIAENLSRENLTDFEKYGIFRRLRDEGIVKTHAELATKLGIARQLVGFVFAFERLPKDVLQHLRANPRLLGAAAAQQLAAWHAEKRTDLVCQAVELLAHGGLEHQAAALEWVRKRLRTPQPKAVRSFASPAGKPVFSLRHAPRQITVSLASGVDPKVLQEVAERLAAALEEAAREAPDAP
jgi:ParB family chromosome partitioning protein